jgi:5-methylcytosine-specific restriction endonuclease McrA
MSNKLIKTKAIATEDDSIDLTGMFEGQTSVGPTRLINRRVLQLNADFSPLSYRPLSTISWEEAMFLLAKGWDRVKSGGDPILTVVEEYEDEWVHSAHKTYKLPSVVALVHMVPLPEHAAFSRNNLYLRDAYTCQYSGIKYPVSELTLDHIHPISKGGKSSWMNLVACSKEVNYRKADRSVKEAGLRLIREPYIPTSWELREKGRQHPSQLLHDSWKDYVFYNVKLDEDT